MTRILYVNAIMTQETGEILKQGLIDGLKSSRAADALTVDSYDIFYGARRYPRLMGEWARDRDYDAVILSGSEKNTTDAGDPWIQDYYQGLRDLLNIRPGRESDWDGPPVPVLGICFGHQALACALGGETSTMANRAGGATIQALPRALSHPVLGRLCQSLNSELKVIIYHADHVVRLPRGFHALFTSDYCDVQGMAHDKWPIFSLQSHPEMNATIKRDSADQATWGQVPASDFHGNAGPQVLGAFLDWVAGR